MKVLVLVTGGRGGSDFFQGLLDGHNEILQIPGILRINNEFKNLFKNNDNNLIAEKFIKFVPLIFDSRKNVLERHNKLGKNKNEYYKVNKRKFINYYKKLSQTNVVKNNSNKINILENLYKAYYLASKRPIKKLKAILIHTHTVEYTEKLFKLENIKNCTIIHTMRHPINAISSPIFNWLKFRRGMNFFPKDLYFQLDLAIMGLKRLCKMNREVKVILLENLINKKEMVMRDFCKIYKLKYSKSMLKSTYFGKQWWGDQISGRWIGKKVHNVENRQNLMLKKVFYQKDLYYFSTITKRISEIYFKKNKLNFYKNKVYFNLIPLKAEILVWKNTFKHKKIKHILSIPYFYIKRIMLLNKLFINNYKLPYSIGVK